MSKEIEKKLIESLNEFNVEVGGKYENWMQASKEFHFTDELIEKYFDYLDYYALNASQVISSKVIIRLYPMILSSHLFKYQKITDDILNTLLIKYPNDFHRHCWATLSNYSNNISLDFIEKHKDKFDWLNLLTCRKLPIDFLERNFKTLDIRYRLEALINYQELTEEFIEKYLISKFALKNLVECQNFSDEFAKKTGLKLNNFKHVKFCGEHSRTIRIYRDNPKKIYIGCFGGTKEEAIKAINKKYGENTEGAKEYIKNVERCFSLWD